MKVPDRAWTRENSPRFSAAEQKARCQAASITSLIAQEYSGVGLTVNQQWPGSRPVNSPRQQDATTGGLCCEIEEHQVSTTITRERLHGVAAWVDSCGYMYSPAPEALTDNAAQLRLDAEKLLETPGVGKAARELCLDEFDAEWIVGSRPNPPAPRPRDWMQSIAAFIRQGPRSAAVPNLMDIALEHNRIGEGDRWRYFRGCCWRRIRERQVVVTFTPAPGVHNSGDLS